MEKPNEVIDEMDWLLCGPNFPPKWNDAWEEHFHNVINELKCANTRMSVIPRHVKVEISRTVVSAMMHDGISLKVFKVVHKMANQEFLQKPTMTLEQIKTALKRI